MKIVIAGAGGIGFHLANLMSFQKKNIVLIDIDQDVLDYAQSHLDVLTIRGDSSSLAILNEAEVPDADMFLAVTTSEKNNLISAILAKKLGARQTIARVSNIEYLNPDQRENFAELGADHLISPTVLAAREIEKLVKHGELTDYFEFEEGIVIMSGITLDNPSISYNHSIREIDELHPDILFRPMAILRSNKTILPDSFTQLKFRDHVYFVAEKDKLNQLLKILGKEKQNIGKIMIVGGSEISLQTAFLLESKYDLTIVIPDKERAKFFIEKLHHALVVEGDPNNIDLLKEEGLDNTDAFIALTPNSETNIITSLMAKQSGVSKTIALVDNIDYTHISQQIGVDTLINKKLIAANNIFRFVRKGKIAAIASPHGVEAEVIEYIIQKNNQLTKKPLSELHFPVNCRIAVVIRDNNSYFPSADFQLQLHDKVIILALHDSINKIEKLFR